MTELDKILQHAGVKGMKWGVIRKGQNAVKSASAKVANSKGVVRVKEEAGSLNRERSWKKVLNDVDNLSTKQINQKVQRIQMENDLKRLAGKKTIGSVKDKQDYRLRGKMSDQELGRKVNRLRAKESLKRNVDEASKSQREFGKRVVETAGPLVVKYALGQKIGPSDIYNAFKNPKQARSEAERDVREEVNLRRQGLSKMNVNKG